jgi:hypothetical protein
MAGSVSCDKSTTQDLPPTTIAEIARVMLAIMNTEAVQQSQLSSTPAVLLPSLAEGSMPFNSLESRAHVIIVNDIQHRPSVSNCMFNVRNWASMFYL